MNKLPPEVLDLVSSFCMESKDKSALCQVNKSFYKIVLPSLYRYLKIKNYRSFINASLALSRSRFLKECVRTLDFSCYTSKGSRLSEETIKNMLTFSDLIIYVKHCPNLKVFLAGEEISNILLSNPHDYLIHFNKLETIEMNGFSGRPYFHKFTSVPNYQLKNISFFMCISLSQNEFFIPLFKNLKMIERLDLSYTQINADLFRHLPKTITHLNIRSCNSLRCCSPLIEFLLGCNNLIELNIDAGVFCPDCMMILFLHLNRLKSLDLSCFSHFNELTAARLIVESESFPNLHDFSIPYCQNLDIFVSRLMPNLNYLGITNKSFLKVEDLSNLLESLNKTKINVVELSHLINRSLPEEMMGWRKIISGNRAYYARNNVDPLFLHSRKLAMLEHHALSPMNKYWSYLY